VMVEKYLFSEADAKSLCEFLSPMLTVDFRARATAGEMAEHPWLDSADEQEDSELLWSKASLTLHSPRLSPPFLSQHPREPIIYSYSIMTRPFSLILASYSRRALTSSRILSYSPQNDFYSTTESATRLHTLLIINHCTSRHRLPFPSLSPSFPLGPLTFRHACVPLRYLWTFFFFAGSHSLFPSHAMIPDIWAYWLLAHASYFPYFVYSLSPLWIITYYIPFLFAVFFPPGLCLELQIPHLLFPALHIRSPCADCSPFIFVST